ncbi:MAG: hypothetical protein J6T10_22815 [Methanobrevibacter sp.]|nr:hypothetical protein [Methanobrevibacter sp.]
MVKDLKIVVFGCDNTGKTTLCNSLNEMLNAEGYKSEIAKSIGANKSVDEYIDFMQENLDKDHIVIFDRFPIIEESTCGRVLRNNDIFEKWSGSEPIDLLENVDVFIFCYPGLFEVLNWGEREQMSGVKENALKLIDAYNQMAVALVGIGSVVIEYNYKVETVSDLFDLLDGGELK